MAEMLLSGTTKNELIGALADQYGEVSENPTGFHIEGDASNYQDSGDNVRWRDHDFSRRR